ncbi:hypothetical protein [Bernardetia sp.]|uniref:hypothetical protein n=1 Tax=Bernardetia sp. TaxID=1937974 RepID=UPI0025BC757C|nr:hypothetical protein [Bernardetia sp.]
MLSKNFIFTALFFTIVLSCISCFRKKEQNQYTELYTIVPTDSSSFTTSLENIEFLKKTTFELDGTWKVEEEVAQKSSTYFIFEGRKVYPNLYEREKRENDYQTFATYNKCPNEGGIFDKTGRFLVIGSGDENQRCYEINYFKSSNLVLYDIENKVELNLNKVR